MPYAIETFEGRRRVGRDVIEEAEQQVVDRAKGLVTPSNVTSVRVVQIESEGDENGQEVWSERREV